MTTNNWSVSTSDLSDEAYVQIYNVRSDINSAASQIGVSSLAIAACLSEEVQDQLNRWNLVDLIINDGVDADTADLAQHADLVEDYAFLTSLGFTVTVYLFLASTLSRALSFQAVRREGLARQEG